MHHCLISPVETLHPVPLHCGDCRTASLPDYELFIFRCPQSHRLHGAIERFDKPRPQVRGDVLYCVGHESMCLLLVRQVFAQDISDVVQIQECGTHRIIGKTVSDLRHPFARPKSKLSTLLGIASSSEQSGMYMPN